VETPYTIPTKGHISAQQETRNLQQNGVQNETQTRKKVFCPGEGGCKGEGVVDEVRIPAAVQFSAQVRLKDWNENKALSPIVFV
jgi:hypothetical protein